MKRHLLLLLLIVCCTKGSFGQIITTIAGNGSAGYSGDSVNAFSTKVNKPTGVAIDAIGNIYISDYLNNRIRKITTCGIITTIAGNGIGSYSGDGGPATAASIFNPWGIAVDTSGNIFFADAGNQCIRKINSSGIISLVAGVPDTSGNTGDGQAATVAKFNNPAGILVNNATGVIYVADMNNNRIRKISGGIVSNYAGWANGAAGNGLSGHPATATLLRLPSGLAFDTANNVVIADMNNHVIRLVNQVGIITNIAGIAGSSGYNSDSILATDANLSYPRDIAIDAQNTIYIADAANSRIRMVRNDSMFTIAGTGTANFNGDNLLATATNFYYPVGLKIAPNGNLVFSDFNNSRIRSVFMNNPPRFTNGHTYYDTVCENTINSIRTIIAVNDTDLGQKLTWSIGVAPSHGTITTPIVDTSVGCSANLPYGINYTPTSGYYGNDTFKMFVSDGYLSDSLMVYVIVKPLPIIPAITGLSNICVGSTNDTLRNDTTLGVWVNNDTTIAKLTLVAGAVAVQGLSVGVDIISYTKTNTCGTTNITKSITVNALPNAGIILGNSSVCQNSLDTLTNSISGGTWLRTNANALLSSTEPGLVKGILGGIDTIEYRVSTTYCGADTAKFTLTIIPLPTHGSITGNSILCIGTTDTLRNTTFSGTTWSWTSLHSDTASLVSFLTDTTAVVTGVRKGADTIRFVIQNSCGADSVQKYLTIKSHPYAGVIQGDSIICFGATESLYDTTANLTGVWGHKDTSVTVYSTGVLHTLTVGSDSVFYAVHSATCGNDTAFKVFHVSSVPHAYSISGASSVCQGSTTTLTGSGTGGTGSWVTINSATFVNALGIVTGLHAGFDSILYIVSSAHCGKDTAYKSITVIPLPNAGVINGQPKVCVGKYDTLTNNVAGVWIVSNLNLSSLTTTIGGNPALITKGIMHGRDTVLYKATNACGTKIDTFFVDVNPKPNAGIISGRTSICNLDTVSIIDTTIGGVFRLINNKLNWVSANIYRANAVGTDTIIYTKGNSCGIDTAKLYVRIRPLPNAGTISGSGLVCKGSKITLIDTVSSGAWFHSGNSVSVSPLGVVFGSAVGVDTVEYIYSNSCGYDTAFKIVQVNVLPKVPPISVHSAPSVCLHTQYQNFGVDTPKTFGIRYEWSVNNAVLYAVDANGQYCLVNFEYPGRAFVKFMITDANTTCSNSDSISINVDGTQVSPLSTVIYSSPEFFSLDNTAVSYQWGYDQSPFTDSFSIAGEILQNYYLPNPDFINKNYWVETKYANSCVQKTYYNTPVSIFNLQESSNVTFKVFPNPSSREVFFEAIGLNQNDNVELCIYDITGKKMTSVFLTDGIGNVSIENWDKGFYLATLVKNGYKVSTKTIVKY